ncbi:MAG: carbohydrate ABC transporter permease [Gorillibacterium sp.]|nr:carbohydrate ABC transporter permease [Gorillibacterium sp.]
MKLSFEDKLLHCLIVLFLLFFAFINFYPFWNALIISFNLGTDTAQGGIAFWPRKFTLENYNVVFQDSRLIRAFGITITRTILGTLLSMLFTGMFGYAMSKKHLIGKKLYMILCVVTMYFGGGLIPSYLLIRELHLMNTIWVLIIPGIISVWNMIIFRTFFMGLPEGLEESARIDGCNPFGIFFRIIVPVSGPVFATLSLFTAVLHWNDWFSASIYMNDNSLFPIQTLLNQLINSNIMAEQLQNAGGGASQFAENLRGVTSRSLVMATMMVATVPIMLVYPFLQKYFVKGVMVGSLKE